MNQRRIAPKRTLLASALLLVLHQPVYAQATAEEKAKEEEKASTQVTPGAGSSAQTLDAIQVEGIRASLQSSMNLKRDAQGIVDGIIAEDIGKFPDTNLAEALQRISGVSIDRTSSGEGSKVTVRGVGPDFNLVLLNGRQMPASSIADTGASGSRAFDFANLAAEAVSQVDVYKTSRASTPTGGIGATINIRTARPLDNPGFLSSVGLKLVNDSSNDNLPDSLQGNDFTPEVSGIFSNTSADGRFGISLTASHQERDSGFNQVAIGNGWKGPFRGDENNWGTIPQPGTPGSEDIINRPDPTDIYSVPQNLNYSTTGLQRTRNNGQLTLQFAPTENVTTTLDYTYSDLKIEQQRNEMSVWFNFGQSASSWTDGPVAAPIVYSEIIPGAGSDLAMGGAMNATKNKNESIGFNVAWEVNDQFNLSLDYHNSDATSGADSPYGSSGVLGTAGFFRGTTTVDFSGEFPVLNVQLPAGMSQIDPAAMLVTGSSFRNSYMSSDVEQIQGFGDFTFENYSRLDFGVAFTDVHNRSAFSNVQQDSWGGATNAGDYPDDVWQLDHMGDYFGNFGGANDPNFTDAFFVWDFATVRQLAANAGNPAMYEASDIFTTDRRTSEKSQSAFLQWSNSFDWGIPVDIAAGVRYEQTDVISKALVPTPSVISWGAANELSVINVQGASQFTRLEGDYEYWLPSLDLGFDLTDDIKLRASYGETIGRPAWNELQGGQTLNPLVRVDGGTGEQGNPGLKPLLSRNFDISFEWYYGESSYASAGWFRKNISNYIGTTQIVDTPFDLHTPVGGAYWNEAIASGCPTADVVCIRNYIFINHDGDPGVDQTGVDTIGNQTGTIVGQPGDPIAEFRITTPANQRDASLDGWEFNLQQMFGESGFGLAANYTIVDSDLTYDNYLIGQQFALEGLSDSANLVLFYDKNQWQARAAYNWRDEFLSGRFDGAGANPNYVEEYGQLDVGVSYSYDEHLSFSLEGINVTDESQRVHGRHINNLLFLTQTGPRYMFGVRYEF